jgi:hypothetical protein
MTTEGDITISTDVAAALKLTTLRLSYLRGNGSPRFSEQHGDALAMLGRLLDTFVEVLREKITAHIRSLMQPVFGKATDLLKALQAHGDGHSKVVQAASPLKEVLTTFGDWAMRERSPKDFLDCMVFPEHMLEINTFWEATRNAILVLKFSLELFCEGRHPTLDNENVEALHDLLDKPLRAMETADGYQVFNHHCIQAMLRTATTAILKSIPESVLSAVLPLFSGGDGDADPWVTASLKQLTDFDVSTLGPVRQCAALISQHLSTLQSKAVIVKGCTIWFAFLVDMPEIVVALHHMLKHRACENVETEDVFKDGGLLTELAEMTGAMESFQRCNFLLQGKAMRGKRFAEKLLSESAIAGAAVVDKALSTMKKDLGVYKDQLEQAPDGTAKSNVATMMDLAETDSISPDVLARMLKLAQSDSARAFYEAWKYMRRIQLDYCMNKEIWDIYTKNATLQADVVALLTYDLSNAAIVVGTITAAQALGRGLKKDETRKKICDTAMLTIKTKVSNNDGLSNLPAKMLAALQERAGHA